jgi:hypothetical protein
MKFARWYLDYDLPGCEAMLFGRKVPTFRINLVPRFLEYKKMGAAVSFKTFLRFYQATRSHIQDDRIEIVLKLSPSLKVQIFSSLGTDTRFIAT